MNVCFVTVALDAFKGGNHLPLLAACKDTQFTILTNHTKPKDPDLPDNVKVETLNRSRLGPYYYGVSDRNFAKAVLDSFPPDHDFWKKFDVIHLNQSLHASLLELKKSGVQVLYTVHHPVTVDRDVAAKETHFATSLKWRMRYIPLIWQQGKLVHGCDRVMTVSETVKKRLQHDYGLKPESINVVLNGVDGDSFVPTHQEPEFDTIAIGSFIHPRKGFPYLYKVYKALSQEGYRIADVGRRSQEQQKKLQTIENVTMLGPVDHDTLLATLQKSKTLLSTARYEGFGLSLIEALSCGKPAFAFDVGAVREVLEPIDAELISSPRDTKSVISKLENFLSLDSNEQKEKGEMYRKKVLELYSMEKSAGQLQELYQLLAK